MNHICTRPYTLTYYPWR